MLRFSSGNGSYMADTVDGVRGTCDVTVTIDAQSQVTYEVNKRETKRVFSVIGATTSDCPRSSGQ